MKPLATLSPIYSTWNDLLLSFWKHFPALHLGLFFLSGIGIYLKPYLFFFLFPFISPKKSMSTLIITTLGFLYCYYLYPSLTLEKEIKGKALIHIDSVKWDASPFSPSLVYDVTLKRFSTHDFTLRRLPCRIYLKKSSNRVLANKDYLLSEATLKQTAPYRYLLTPAKDGIWKPLPWSFSFAEWRYQFKKKVKKRLNHLFQDKQVNALMTTLITGDLQHRLLSFQFGRLGLKHLLAISGFHFALLSFLLLTLLRSYLSERTSALLLLLFLGAYSFYLGNAPSISRAWLAIFLFLIARLFYIHFSAFNALGMALFLALLETPLIVMNIGFQLSFAATIGILLFYAPCEKRLRSLLPKRSFEEALALFPLDRLGYLLTTYLRKALSLNIAVMLFTLPLILLHFHKFPLLSVLYNLFFPLLFSVLMIFALFSFTLPLFAPIATLYATFLLTLIIYSPRRFGFYIRTQALPTDLALILFLTLVGIGIAFQSHCKNSL